MKNDATSAVEQRPELVPNRIYNPAEIAAIMGDVSSEWVTQQFPQFWIGKKWRALGRHFDLALSPAASDARGGPKDMSNGDGSRGDTLLFNQGKQHF